MLNHDFAFMGEAKKIDIKIVEYYLYKIAHSGSNFDGYLLLSNLHQWRNVILIVENGAGIVSLIIFNGNVDERKKFFIMFVLDVEKYISGLFQEKLVLVINYNNRYLRKS